MNNCNQHDLFHGYIILSNFLTNLQKRFKGISAPSFWTCYTGMPSDFQMYFFLDKFVLFPGLICRVFIIFQLDIGLALKFETIANILFFDN